jgi:polyphosphate kinase
MSPDAPSRSASDTKADAPAHRKSQARAAAHGETSHQAAAAAAPAPAQPSVVDLDSPQWYLNRELTWLEFNRRVLAEAQDARVPLLERLKFLAIVSSNLDEFFMKRIGGLKQQIGAGLQSLSVDGRTASEQLDLALASVKDLSHAMRHVEVELFRLLAAEGIQVRRFAELSAAERETIGAYYRTNIFPLVTPLGIDPAHPFPFISNLSLNLLVALRPADSKETSLVRIKIPTGPGVSRFIRVGDSHVYVAIEDLVADHLHLLFPDARVEAQALFRVTRNAVVEKSEEAADDLLALIESEVRERKFAPIVRLEVSSGIRPLHRGKLAAELGLDESRDVFELEGLMARKDLFQLASIDRPDLRDAPHQPADHPILAGAPNIFHAIREHGSILVAHPYQSFVTSVERFLAEASTDPKVLAIKMTLYRTASQSKIIEHLIAAARNGKQVAVVVELKARFDEAANIRWADYLEEEGIHVSYGLVGLKIHSKIVFVIRHDFAGLRRYAHIGTGNYHAGTARMYCDLGLFTADPDIAADLTELFNHLTSGVSTHRHYRKLLPAPVALKPALLAKIDREIDMHRAGKPAHIQFKCNALEDRDIVRALYRASQAGVPIDCVVRDTCRLRPGIPGLSETVRVVSIVGRFLEHGRIYYFRNGGDEEYLIGSADCMTRNLESRVEVVAPVEKAALRKTLRHVLDLQLADRRGGWDMQSDGSYVQRRPAPGQEARSAQDILAQEMREIPEAR